MAEKNLNYSPIALGNTTGLSNDEWLKWREHGPHYSDPLDPNYIPVTVGGSAVSVIFGDNPWKSKLEFYHEKSGVAQPKYKRPMNQAILDAGHELEEFVANMFVKKMAEEGVTDVEKWADTMLYQHPYFKFAVCNLDRRIKVNGVPGILECKTTGNWNDISLWKQGIVPKKYEWQCRYYMATMNLNYCYICCCWGFTTNECAVILITRDLEIEKVMMEEVKEFVECCEMGVEPEMQTAHMETLAKYYTRLYGEIKPDAPAVELPDSAEVYELVEAAASIAERKAAVEAQMDKLEEEEYKITSMLMSLIGGDSTYATYRVDDDNVYAIKLKLPMKKAGFDEEALKQDEPALFNQYQKSSLDVTKFKKENKELAKKYIIPATVNIEKPVSLDKVELKNIPLKAIS